MTTKTYQSAFDVKNDFYYWDRLVIEKAILHRQHATLLSQTDNILYNLCKMSFSFCVLGLYPLRMTAKFNTLP